LINKLSKY